MKTIKRVIAAASLFAAAGAASAIPFSITNAVFTPGSGYGADASETGGTQLGVVFSNAGFTQPVFDLPTVSSSFSFVVGTVNFNEPNGIGGITNSEVDNLGVSLALTFAAPGSAVNTVLAAGAAFVGSVQDNAVDYTLSWLPVVAGFGNSGLYTITLAPLSFTTNGTQTLTAQVTLTAIDAAAAVPEPGSLALLGAGLLSAAMLRRRNIG